VNPLLPQLLPFSDAALLSLRLVVAVVFFESGRRHAADPLGRAASIGLSPGLTRFLGLGEMAAAHGAALHSESDGESVQPGSSPWPTMITESSA